MSFFTKSNSEFGVEIIEPKPGIILDLLDLILTCKTCCFNGV